MADVDQRSCTQKPKMCCHVETPARTSMTMIGVTRVAEEAA